MQYQQVIDFIHLSGLELKEKWGIAKDIGITKKHVTEYDYKIERGLKEIIRSYGTDHSLYAEAENNSYKESANLWIADPISGTSWFLNRAGSFAIVVAHMFQGVLQFGLIHDPIKEETFHAEKGKGFFINGVRQQRVNLQSESILFNPSMGYVDEKYTKQIWQSIFPLKPYKIAASFALGYTYVASGRFAGVITLQKDTFPEFAGKIILEEAGCVMTNGAGNSSISFTDRVFVAGYDAGWHSRLLTIVRDSG